MTLATPPEPTIVADSRLTINAPLGDIPSGSFGTAWDKPSTPTSWSEPAVWVFWDDQRHYPRWVPVRLLTLLVPRDV